MAENHTVYSFELRLDDNHIKFFGGADTDYSDDEFPETYSEEEFFTGKSSSKHDDSITADDEIFGGLPNALSSSSDNENLDDDIFDKLSDDDSDIFDSLEDNNYDADEFIEDANMFDLDEDEIIMTDNEISKFKGAMDEFPTVNSALEFEPIFDIEIPLIE